MPPNLSIKARIARMFLNFLDEHGNYRSQLEEAAARAAAASASDLLAKERGEQWRKMKKKQKKKKRKIGGRFRMSKDGGDGGSDGDAWREGDDGADEGDFDGEDEEGDELDDLLLDYPEGSSLPDTFIKKFAQLPEDPYEQIQFYFHTFRTRTRLQLEQQMEHYKNFTKKWMHDELHHQVRVPLASFGILATASLILGWRRRQKRMRHLRRIHGVLGKKFDIREYVHPNFFRGRVWHECTAEGKRELEKLEAKAMKAEEAALASMRPYQRKKYERFQKLERWGEKVVLVWLFLGIVASGCAFCISLSNLIRIRKATVTSGDGAAAGAGAGAEFAAGGNDNITLEEKLDGHIYSLDGPTDSDGYPIGMRELAEENYAACLLDAENDGIRDPSQVCNVESFFEEAVQKYSENQDSSRSSLSDKPPTTPTSPLRIKIKSLLTKLGVPPPITDYLSALQTQTLAYLSSLASFLLFLLSHYISHKLHIATLTNDPMKHFVATAADSTIKADGTVEAKRGETEAQRKKRERMLQSERLKAKMAQLAMEAKQRVDERRRRLEGMEAVKQEEEEKQQKVYEEQEEVVKNHGRQFMMVKAGVPEDAILQSFSIEGLEDEEAREILGKLKEIKLRRAEERRKQEEEEEKKKEEEEEREKEQERIAAERLRLMKQGGGGGSGATRPSLPQSQYIAPRTAKKKDASSVTSATTGSVTSVKTSSTAGGGREGRVSNNAAGKGKMLGDIQALRKTPSTVESTAHNNSKKEDPSISKGKMLGEIGRIKSDGPSLRKINSVKTMSQNGQVSTYGDKFKRSNSTPLNLPPKLISHRIDATPPHANSNKPTSLTSDASHSTNIEISKNDIAEEEKKGEEMESVDASASTIPKAAVPQDRKDNKESFDEAETPSPPPITRVSSTENTSKLTPGSNFLESQPTQMTFDCVSAWDRRPSARAIQATIEAVEQNPEGAPPPISLGPSSYHSPSFDMALRNSNASWDRRPSSRDIMARIKAAEESEAKASSTEADKTTKRIRVRMRDSSRNRKGTEEEPGDALAIIDEHGKIEANASFEVNIQQPKLRKAKSGGAGGEDDSDGSISEISMTTYEDNSLDNSLLSKRSIPKNLFLPSESDRARVPFSPALTSSPCTGYAELTARRMSPDKVQSLIRMAEKGELNLPTVPDIEKDIASTSKSTKSDAASGKSGTKSSGSKGGGASEPKVETEEEKLKRIKAEARAKKFEEMAEKRRAATEDQNTSAATSGISKRHRVRRKKSAMAAISPEERERNEWKKGIFNYVLNAEQAHWRRCVFSHVICAEETRVCNLEAQRVIEEQNEEAQRRMENRNRLDLKAKKFAARAKKFHQLRRGEPADDDSSVVSSTSKLRRRRGRKSSSKSSRSVPETSVTSEPVANIGIIKENDEEAKEKADREQWCRQIFTSVIEADQCLWRKNIYFHVINAEGKREERLQLEEELQTQRALAEARREREKQNELRKKKMERIQRERSALAALDENADADEGQSVVSSSAGGSSMKKMRDRRKKAAQARKAAKS
mmetsp:Transcript_30973/g.62347  ORF Transcript_30973/g.62347 Transcript_30973/m.62347 type:complete len:1533 (+) Transcript_30973:326-4924(+)